MQGNTDFSKNDMGASQPLLITETSTGIVSTFNAVDIQPEIVSSTQTGAHLNLSQVCDGLFYRTCLSSVGPILLF